MINPDKLHEAIEHPDPAVSGIVGPSGASFSHSSAPMVDDLVGREAEPESDGFIAEQLFLLGRPPLPEFLGVVVQTGAATNTDLPRLADEWRSANDRVHELQVVEAGFADNPTITDLPPALEPLAAQTTTNPVFQHAFGLVPSRFGLVELDKLVVFQKHIDLAQVRRIQETLGSCPTDEQIFAVCAQPEGIVPPAQAGQVAGNAWGFVSRSGDLRFLEARLVTASELPGFVTSGRPTHVLMLAVGFGSNYLNAIHVEGRLLLGNGSHRAYALRSLGVTHVPCVIQEITRREELPLVLSAEVVQNIDTYVCGPRPSVLKDYFNPSLVKRLPLVQRDTQVRLSFGVELVTMPATSD